MISISKYLLHLTILLASALIFAAPTHAANLFNCCYCKVALAEKNANFCLNVISTSNCVQASADLEKIYNDKKFTANCEDLSKEKCVKISSGNASAMCPFDPVTHKSAATSQINKAYLDTTLRNKEASKQQELTTTSENHIPAPLGFSLNIPIPGVTFPKELYVENQILYIPYLAIYLSAFQKYLLGIGIILAAIMLVVGGFKYLISATGAKVQQSKEMIEDALIGLVLLLGCYVILANVNPNAVIMSTLKVPYVKPDYMEPATGPMHDVPGNAQKTDINALIEGVKMAKGDPCAVLSFCEHESGLRQIWNGWPRNPKETSFSWGACSADAKFTRDGSEYDVLLRKNFPGIWPELGTDLPIPKGQSANYKYNPIKAEILINNSKINGFLAARYAKNSIKAIADAGIGSANIDRWRLKNCTGEIKDISLSQAAVMGVEEAIKASCIPTAAAGGEHEPKNCKSDNYNCGPFDPEGKGPLGGYKVMPNGEVHGKCASTGAECFTILTQSHIRYSIKAYQRFDSKYKCTSGAKKSP